MKKLNIASTVKTAFICSGIAGYFLMLYGISNDKRLSGFGALILFIPLILLNIRKGNKNKQDIDCLSLDEVESELIKLKISSSSKFSKMKFIESAEYQNLKARKYFLTQEEGQRKEEVRITSIRNSKSKLHDDDPFKSFHQISPDPTLDNK